jgi:hypothetical protein
MTEGRRQGGHMAEWLPRLCCIDRPRIPAERRLGHEYLLADVPAFGANCRIGLRGASHAPDPSRISARSRLSACAGGLVQNRRLKTNRPIATKHQTRL